MFDTVTRAELSIAVLVDVSVLLDVELELLVVELPGTRSGIGC